MDLIQQVNDNNSELRYSLRITACLSFAALGCLMLGCGRTSAIPPVKVATPNKAMFPTATVTVDAVDTEVSEPILKIGEQTTIDVKFSMPGRFALPLPTVRLPKVFPGTIMLCLMRGDQRGNELCEFETEFTGGGFTPLENSGTATLRVNIALVREGSYEMRVESEPDVYPKAHPPERVVMFSRIVRVVVGRK